jgi:hypothetical protein
LSSDNRWNANLLKHEIWFGGLIFSCCFMLLTHKDLFATETLVYAILLLINGAIIYYGESYFGDNYWSIRLSYYPCATVIIYLTVGHVSDLLGPGQSDNILQSIDQLIFDQTPIVRWQHLRHLWLTEFASLLYLLFFPYFAHSCYVYLKQPLNLAQRYYTGMFCLITLAFVGYILLPSAGPYLALKESLPAPDSLLFGNLLLALQTKFSNQHDAFPSLLVALCVYTSGMDVRYRRHRFICFILPCIGFCWAGFYLGYHYAIDYMAALLLGFAGLYIGLTTEKSSGNIAKLP